jgi:hypothetical protein
VRTKPGSRRDGMYNLENIYDSHFIAASASGFDQTSWAWSRFPPTQPSEVALSGTDRQRF